MLSLLRLRMGAATPAHPGRPDPLARFVGLAARMTDRPSAGGPRAPAGLAASRPAPDGRAGTGRPLPAGDAIRIAPRSALRLDGRALGP